MFRYKEDKKIDPYAQINIVTQIHNIGLPIDDDYLYETFNIDKPKDYEAQKKAKEELKVAMQKATEATKENEDDNEQTSKPTNIQKRALGFFDTVLVTGGDLNTDW